MGTGREMGAPFQKGIRNSSMGTGQEMETSFQKGIRNSSMGTGQEMERSFQKGIKKFVNRYRAKNGNVFAKKY